MSSPPWRTLNTNRPDTSLYTYTQAAQSSPTESFSPPRSARIIYTYTRAKNLTPRRSRLSPPGGFPCRPYLRAPIFFFLHVARRSAKLRSPRVLFFRAHKRRVALSALLHTCPCLSHQVRFFPRTDAQSFCFKQKMSVGGARARRLTHHKYTNAYIIMHACTRVTNATGRESSKANSRCIITGRRNISPIVCAARQASEYTCVAWNWSARSPVFLSNARENFYLLLPIRVIGSCVRRDGGGSVLS